MGFEKPLTGAERVAKRRAALRAQGLKPKTIWVPDRKNEAFKERARLDCERAWALVPEDEQAMAFVEAMTDELLRDHPY
jgi:Protein  of unknown function (DUF3018)